MASPLTEALDEIRAHLLDDSSLVRAVAAGRRRGAVPPWRRVELRYVDLKAGRHLQVTAYDRTQAFTSNHLAGDDAAGALDELLAEPFGNWHVDTTSGAVQLRVTKKGEAMVHRTRASGAEAVVPDRSHDRAKTRLLDPDDPVLLALGIRERKYRQVEELVRALVPALDDAIAAGHLRTPTETDPLRIVDLGCGNGYLTFAVLHHLTATRALPVRVVGVDVKEQSRRHNSEVAERLGLAGRSEFIAGTIRDVVLDPPPDVVLALHACDTATDDVLARAVHWGSGLVLAAPCCHHDIAGQLRQADSKGPYAVLTRHGILRERLGDTLTDGLRAAIMRREGYRVDVVEFVESRHTPRNTLLRATRTGSPSPGAAAEVAAIVDTWSLHPALEDRLRALS